MLVACSTTLEILHSLLRLCGIGAPYLLIISWVRQTCLVLVIPGGMDDCCQAMLVVISHRPGFLVLCAPAKSVIVNRQQPMVIKTRVLCMNSPVRTRQLVAAQVFTLSQRASGRKVKSQPPPSATSVRSGLAFDCVLLGVSVPPW